MTRLLAAFACLVAAPALADTACDQPNKDLDGLCCLNKIYQQADADLNTAYGRLHAKLDSQGRSSVKTGQLAWIDQPHQCDVYVDLQCATHVTIERTQLLQDRARECTSAGCLNSKLN